MLGIALHDSCLQCFIFELLQFAEPLWPGLKFRINEQHQFYTVLWFTLEKEIVVGLKLSAQNTQVLKCFLGSEPEK